MERRAWVRKKARVSREVVSSYWVLLLSMVRREEAFA